jgi:DUF4097 and DUF4098 domain-containing protein YvlB
MNQERIEVGKQPHIEVTECQGNMIVRSWAETAVLIKGDECEVNETEAGLSLAVHGSVKITLPVASSLAINDVQGNFTVKKLDGTVSLQTVMGNASVRQVGSTKIGTVHGDLQAKNLEGSLSIETVYGDVSAGFCSDAAIGTVHGDLSARSIDGNTDIVAVMGDISLRNIAGDVSIKQGSRDANLRNLTGDTNTVGDIAGDIRLRGPLNPGEHTFTANGDIIFHWPANEPLELEATAPRIKNKIFFNEMEESDNSLTGQIGEGGPSVVLNAYGQIVLKEHDQHKGWTDSDMDFNFDFDVDFDVEGFTEKINNEVFAQVNRFTDEFENKFGPDFAETMARKAQKEAAKIEKAAGIYLRDAYRCAAFLKCLHPGVSGNICIVKYIQYFCYKNCF